MFKKINLKKNLMAFAFALAIAIPVGSALVASTPVLAAADPSITTGIASGTAAIGDNISPIVTFVVYAVIAVFGLSMVVILLNWGLGKIKGIFSRRRKGRR